MFGCGLQLYAVRYLMKDFDIFCVPNEGFHLVIRQQNRQVYRVGVDTGDAACVHITEDLHIDHLSGICVGQALVDASDHLVQPARMPSL
jgi:hypothetical protein